MKPTDFSYYLTSFLTKYLPSECGSSQHTIASYRDTFVLFLSYLRHFHKLPAHRLILKEITHEKVVHFLEWIEVDRGCSVSTRNVRLAAIHSFFNYMQYAYPDLINEWQQIMTIPTKKTETTIPTYMALDAISLLLQMPDQSTKSGRRDLALLALMFDTGARVSEIITLKAGMVRLDTPCTIKVIGKGRKVRIIPLLMQQTDILRNYMTENNLSCSKANEYPLFPNKNGKHMTRQGITYIVKKYVKMAKDHALSVGVLVPDKISCHSIRHSKAMAMMGADIDLIYIRDLLGHVSVKTTEIYARIDSEKKRQAMEQAYDNTVVPDAIASWESDDELMAWLKSFDK